MRYDFSHLFYLRKKLSLSRKHIIVGLSLVLLLASIPLGFSKAKELQKDRLYKEQIKELIKLSNVEKLTAFQERTDSLRTFIATNSSHNMDEEFYSIWRDQTAIANVVLAYIKGERKDLPHLECSTRTGLVASLYRELGYRTRGIVVFNTSDQLASHTLLEVQNPETKNWELQDTDYNIFWRHKESGKRASIIDLMKDPQMHEPCNNSKPCGWDDGEAGHKNAENLLNYLGIASIIDKQINRRLSVYAKDTDPENIYNTAQNGTGSFCDVWKKNCRQGFQTLQDYRELE